MANIRIKQLADLALSGQGPGLIAADGTLVIEQGSPNVSYQISVEDLFLEANTDTNIANTVVAGTLDVQSTATLSVLNVLDNKLTLNSDVVGLPSQNVFIVVNRGSSADAEIKWDEAIDRWDFRPFSVQAFDFFDNNGETFVRQSLQLVPGPGLAGGGTLTNSREFRIKDDGVITSMIDDSAVTTPKINDLSVTTDKLDNLSVTTDKLGNESITTPKFNPAAVAPDSARLGGVLAAEYVQRSRRIEAGFGLVGGGDLSGNRTISLDPNAIPSSSVTFQTVTNQIGMVPNLLLILPPPGISGGTLVTGNNFTIALDPQLIFPGNATIKAGSTLTISQSNIIGGSGSGILSVQGIANVPGRINVTGTITIPIK